MERRIPVTIAGKEYTLISEDNGEYLEKLARSVDAKILSHKRELHISELDAAVLTAMELADECLKANEREENARAQIQSCLEDASKARAEAAELKRELSRLKR